MTILVPIALFGWAVASFMLFLLRPPRSAAAEGLVAGWLLLPMAQYSFAGLPNYGKAEAATMGVLFGALALSPILFRRLKPNIIDLFALMWLGSTVLTSLSNGLGLYDGISALMTRTVQWGLPYLVGRAMFCDEKGARAFLTAVFVGGVLYVPLCLYEIRMSPQLHSMLYGYFQHGFAQTVRGGGWRPVVFMQHGLAVGIWLSAAALAGLYLQRLRLIPGRNRQIAWLGIVGLVAVALIARNWASIGFLFVGAAIILLVPLRRLNLMAMVLSLGIVVYLSLRIVLGWSPTAVVEQVAALNQGRAGSLDMRIRNEARLVTHTASRPVFGWGGWGRNRRVDDGGDEQIVTDSYWIIAYSVNGAVGLVGLYGVLLGPVIMAARRRRIVMDSPATAGMSVVILLFAADTMLNAMINPVFIAGAGGLASAAASQRVTRRRRMDVTAAPATPGAGRG